MSIVGRDRYSEDMIVGRRYRASSCPRCKARTLDEAANACRPVQDPSGEYNCPGSESMDPFGVKWDATGAACELTNASAKAEARILDAWVREQIAEMDPTP